MVISLAAYRVERAQRAKLQRIAASDLVRTSWPTAATCQQPACHPVTSAVASPALPATAAGPEAEAFAALAYALATQI